MSVGRYGAAAHMGDGRMDAALLPRCNEFRNVAPEHSTARVDMTITPQRFIILRQPARFAEPAVKMVRRIGKQGHAACRHVDPVRWINGGIGHPAVQLLSWFDHRDGKRYRAMVRQLRREKRTTEPAANHGDS